MRELRVLRGLALAAGGLAALGVAYFLIMPIYCSQRNSNGSIGPQTCYRVFEMSDLFIAEQNRRILTYLALLIVVFLLGIASAILYSWTRQTPWRLVLWGTAVVSVLFSVLSAASIGLVFIPAAFGLLVAAAVSSSIPASPAPLAS